jgi:phosphonate transport system permease protein
MTAFQAPAVLAIEDSYLARRRARRLASLGALAVLAVALLISARISEAYPDSLAAGLPRVGEYFRKLTPALQWHALLSGPKVEGSIAYWFYRFGSWSWLLFETSQMALLATFLGGILGCALSFPAAANLAPNRVVYFATRRLLELFRTVPDIVYALILVWAFGIGPIAGIFAIALHTIGAIGKQFAEVVENADMKPWDGIRSAGGNWVQGVRYAILPQVLPNFVSYILLRFEINVRGATVIGFVGAGGIGQELYQVISFNYYEEISAICVMIIAVVAAIDLISERLRSLAMGRPAR